MFDYRAYALNKLARIDYMLENMEISTGVDLHKVALWSCGGECKQAPSFLLPPLHTIKLRSPQGRIAAAAAEE